MNLANLITNKALPANLLKTILTQLFHHDWVTWEIETLVQEIKRLYNVVPTRVTIDKIQALRAIATSDQFQLSAAVFENIVLALNGSNFDPLELQYCSPEEIAFAVLVSEIPIKDFGKEIIAYIRVCMKEAGLLRYPKVLHGIEDGDPELIAKITPKFFADTGDDLVKTQSTKLYVVESGIAKRILPFENLLTDLTN